MATSAAALIRILGSATLSADSPYSGPVSAELENNTNGRRFKNGTGSGQVDRVYQVDGTLGAGATDDYDLLAAGSLTDVYGQAIDADELKAIVIKCNTGEVSFQGNASNQLSLFTSASQGIVLGAGATAGFDLGAAGIDVTTNSKFEILDSDGGGSTYSLWLICAQ